MVRVPLDRRRAFALGGFAFFVIAIALLVVDPFGGSQASGSSLDNGSPISTQRVTRQDLTSQTQVSATLGYADPSSVAVPSGTAPSDMQQAQQTTTSAQSALHAAQATLASDGQALEQAHAALAADRSKQSIDCNGVNAAQSGGGGASGGASVGACAADAQTVVSDRQALTAAALKVAADREAVASAQTSLTAAQQAFAEADASAATYGQTSVYTVLPKVGAVITRANCAKRRIW